MNVGRRSSPPRLHLLLVAVVPAPVDVALSLVYERALCIQNRAAVYVTSICDLACRPVLTLCSGVLFLFSAHKQSTRWGLGGEVIRRWATKNNCKGRKIPVRKTWSAEDMTRQQYLDVRRNTFPERGPQGVPSSLHRPDDVKGRCKPPEKPFQCASR